MRRNFDYAYIIAHIALFVNKGVFLPRARLEKCVIIRAMAKRKILFTSHTANFQKFNRPLMRMLRGKLEAPYDDLNIGGWQVDYASANEEKIQDADNVYKVDFVRSPLRFDRHLKAYRQLKKIIAEGDYEVIHTHTPVGSIVTRWAAKSARKKGVKVIYTCHGFHFYDGAPKSYWALWYRAEKMMAKCTDLIITINREDYNRAKNDFGRPTKMIDGVGIDTTKFNTTLKATDKKKLRKEIGLDEKDFAICYVAEFIDRKNHEMLLKAAAPVLREKKDVKIVLLGKGELQDKMRQLVEELGISEQVLFLGYRDDVYNVLQCCDLCVATSKSEGLGLGVLEAVLCGCSIIISDNRGHRDIVDDKKKYLFALNDVDSLTKKMRDAIKNPKKYHLEFPERYSLRNSLTEMKEIYKEFLG